MAVEVVRYESLGKFVEASVEYQNSPYPDMKYASSSWLNYLSYPKAIKLAKSGCDEYVPKAESLMEKIDAAVEVPHSEWIPSVYGAYPIVPEYLAGSPTPMRHKTQVPSDASPVGIYVATGSYGHVSAEQMLNRGCAIMALVLKLQQVRPVELYLVGENGGGNTGNHVIVYPIESKPLQVSVAAFTICNVGFTRLLEYNLVWNMTKNSSNPWTGQWPRNWQGGGVEWEQILRPAIGMTPTDLYIAGAGKDPLIYENPVAWVNAQVKRFVEVTEEI